MIDLQKSLEAGAMIAFECTGEAICLRTDATKYVESGQFDLAMRAIIHAEWCEAVSDAHAVAMKKLAEL